MIKENTMLEKISLKTNSRKEIKAEEPITKQENPITKAPNVVRQFIIRKTLLLP